MRARLAVVAIGGCRVAGGGAPRCGQQDLPRARQHLRTGRRRRNSTSATTSRRSSSPGSRARRAALCVAVDGSGNVVTSTIPTGGASKWTVTNVDGSQLPRGRVVPIGVAVRRGRHPGNVVTSTDPTGGAAKWTATDVDGAHALYGVSCASASLCVAVDDAGNVVTSTDPTGGAAKWTATNVDAGHSCGRLVPSTSLCVAVDTAATSSPRRIRPAAAAAWTVAERGRRQRALRAFPARRPRSASRSTRRGNIVTSTDPTGGAVGVDGDRRRPRHHAEPRRLLPLDARSASRSTTRQRRHLDQPDRRRAAWTVTDVDGTDISPASRARRPRSASRSTPAATSSPRPTRPAARRRGR